MSQWPLLIVTLTTDIDDVPADAVTPAVFPFGALLDEDLAFLLDENDTILIE